jgi:hypothetical protein
MLTQTLNNIVSAMALDTNVAQNNVAGRRWYSRLSGHCLYRPWKTLFEIWLWEELLLKIKWWDGAGTQDSLRVVNTDLV